MALKLSLRHEWAELCKHKKARVAFPESRDPRILQAVSSLLKSQSLFEVFLFLSKSEGEKIFFSQNINLAPFSSRIHWLEDTHSDLRKQTLQFIKNSFHKKEKSIDDATLNTLSEHHLYQASYLLHAQQLDCVLAGCVHSTAEVIRAARLVNDPTSKSTVSGAFVMSKDDQHFLFADCAVQIDPNVSQLVDIANESVKFWQNTPVLNKQAPKVAFLSFSTKGSAKHPEVDKITQATQMFKSQYPQVLCDGEIQLDAAIDPQIAQRKDPHSSIKGEANILIFPNLNAGNIAYKLTQRLAHFEAYGPLLFGLDQPYSDLSRGASSEDIITCTYVNILRAKI